MISLLLVGCTAAGSAPGLDYRVEHGYPVVWATVQGAGLVRLAVNVGAFETVIRRTVARRLKLEAGRTYEVGGLDARIRLASVVDSLPVPGIDGVLGLDSLEGYSLAMDLVQRRLAVWKSDASDEKATTWLKDSRRSMGQGAPKGGFQVVALADRPGPGLFLEAKEGGERLNLLITSALSGTALPGSKGKRLGALTRSLTDSEQIGLIPKLTIGGLLSTPLPFFVREDSFGDGRIALGDLPAPRYVLDVGQRRVCFDWPGPIAVRAKLASVVSGVDLTFLSEQVVIANSTSMLTNPKQPIPTKPENIRGIPARTLIAATRLRSPSDIETLLAVWARTLAKEGE